MKKLVLILIIVFPFFCFSQDGVSINTTGNPADNSAILDVSATGRGLLIPRMTTANRPVNPVESLLIYNTDTQCFEAYNATTSQWVNIACLGCTVPAAPDAGTNVPSATHIVWNWNTVSGATGYKWSTTNDYSTATATSPAGTTSCTQESLTCNTSYTLYVWAFNSCGNSSATALTQTTLACGPCSGVATVTDKDGNVYNAVIIGTQCWLKENLKTTKYNDNTAIPNVTDNAAWTGLGTGAYSWYNNDYNTYGSTYGALYNWYAGNTAKLCPTGWHVPTDAEWTTLTDNLGGESVAGGKMKESGTAHWNSPNTDADNSSGFTVLPGGYRGYGNGLFYALGNNANFWTATGFNGVGAWDRYLGYDNANVGRSVSYKTTGVSARCLKD